MEEKKERIAKFLARAGVASRRAVEAMIAQGRIELNGKTLDTPAIKVDERDNIRVDGKKIAETEPTKLFLFHKPNDLVTSHNDEKGRETVFDYIRTHHPELPRLISVGRLDLTTEGLLLLSNNGELARYMELPKTGWIRTYRVRIFGPWDDTKTQKLQNGMNIDGVKYAPIKVFFDGESGQNRWLTVSLKEGKNREIRKAMSACGVQVNRLIRTSYGPFKLGKLAVGRIEQVTKPQMKNAFPKNIYSD